MPPTGTERYARVSSLCYLGMQEQSWTGTLNSSSPDSKVQDPTSPSRLRDYPGQSLRQLWERLGSKSGTCWVLTTAQPEDYPRVCKTNVGRSGADHVWQASEPSGRKLGRQDSMKRECVLRAPRSVLEASLQRTALLHFNWQ